MGVHEHGSSNRLLGHKNACSGPNLGLCVSELHELTLCKHPAISKVTDSDNRCVGGGATTWLLVHTQEPYVP
jgi:hypothetical protein